MNETNLNPLVAMGVGIGVGVCGLWILLETWPILILGGAAYLVYKGVQKTTKESIDICSGTDKK